MKLSIALLSAGLLLTQLGLSVPTQAQQTAVPAIASESTNTDKSTNTATWALQQLVDLLQQTNSLTADIEQLLMDQDGRELQETRAHLTMLKPSKFRWEVTQPYNDLMVTDGTTIWRYEPDLEQVTIQTFDGKLDRTPVMLLNGTAASIGVSYEVSAAAIDNGKQMRFTLLPKKPDSLFERMNLTFLGPELVEMQFADSLGQQTSLSFHNIQRNQALAAPTFTFQPPTGVEVIDSRLH